MNTPKIQCTSDDLTHHLVMAQPRAGMSYMETERIVRLMCVGRKINAGPPVPQAKSEPWYRRFDKRK